MKRTVFLTYGIANYVAFLVVYAYMAAFVGDFLVAKTIDSPVDGPVGQAVAVNFALVLLFGLQHSVMARPGFKQVWTRVVPKPIERSTYMLFSNLAVIVLMWQWQPIDAYIWDFRGTPLGVALWALFTLGWLLVPAVAAMINTFDLFGLRQVWLHYTGRPYTALPFKTPLAYAHVRHPLYLGWMLAFWATPAMSAGHLLFASSLTAYMVLAARVEERDLVNHFGETYARYRSKVPMFVPRLAPVRVEDDRTVLEEAAAS